MKKILLSSMMSALLMACTHTDVPTASSLSLPSQFEHTENATGSADIRQWWTFWNDAQLTRLIEQALNNNKDIALAQARLAEARYTAQLADADKGMTIGVGSHTGIGHSNLDDIPVIHSHNDTMKGAIMEFAVSWEPDFFGKKQSDADAAMYAALSKAEQLYATQLAITARLAQTYFQLNSVWQFHALLNDHIRILNRLSHYMQGRFQSGYITHEAIDEVKNNLLLLRAQQSDLQAQADSLQRQIAVLIGQSPQSVQLQKNISVLHYTPPSPSGQVPGSVMERRPDIRAYALAIKARAAQVASAKADLLPRFDIQFLGQGGRISLSHDLADMTGLGGFILAGIQLPIFTNGRIHANIHAADARLKASITEYDQALLQALAEVESYYQMSDALTQKVALLEKAVQQQQQQSKATYTLFTHGKQTLDTVLHSQLNILATQQELNKARLQRQENSIQLYKALGGGW